MAFDSVVALRAPLSADMTAAEVIDRAGAPCPVWTAENPDRALAWLYVAPADCMAVDILTVG